jgi:hypothetical protein
LLGKIADFYEDDVEAAIDALTAMIEPLMMIFVGCVVGVILVAMYMPMFKMLMLVVQQGTEPDAARAGVRPARTKGSRLFTFALHSSDGHLTPCCDYRPMSRCVVAVTAAAGLAVALVGGSSAVNLPPGWTHVSVNVIVHHVPETQTYDRGRVTAVGASSLTLRESDGSTWVINVAPTALVTINGQPGGLAQVRPGDTAQTVSINGTAQKVVVRIPPAPAPRQARQAARLARRTARTTQTTQTTTGET